MAENKILEKICGIYVIRHVASGRVYVGSSKDITKRWSYHCGDLRCGKHHSVFLQKSWDIHGAASFEFAVVETVERSEELLAREQHWIDTLKAFDLSKGFNAYPTAGSPRGTKGKAKAPEHAAKLRALCTARNKTAEMRAITALRNKTPEQSSAITRALKGKPKSPGHVAQIRAALASTPKVKRPNYRKQPRSPEHEAKLHAIVLERNTSPENRARQSDRMREKWAASKMA